ncbi:HigA family addiction module antitoxin [Companilactobacillus sp. HBUAS56257]|uniref:HigA family addiction module antitoxin n=1 Tax=Companilactobacillus sp. HBUAS56257 TaxID=3109360 RepID=UPI002FF1CA04
MNKIPTPKVSEILKKEFLEPLNLPSRNLASETKIPSERIEGILSDQLKITVDDSKKLGQFFNVSKTYFLDIQKDIDKRSI